MKRFLLLLFALLLPLLAILTVRTLRFDSRQMHVPSGEPIQVGMESAVARFSGAIQFQTVSDQNIQQPAANEFLRLHDFLETSFPKVHAQLSKEIVGGYSLLYTWKGTDDRLKPILLLGHMDVVPTDPATERNWTYPPFSGHVAEGYIWGRGTIDDKVNVLGLLEATEYLLAQGFRPQRTLYFAFGHDEELGGLQGAAKLASLLHQRRVSIEFVLDEGGFIIDGILPGIEAPIAMIGIAEKGDVSVSLAVKSAGGHSSIPPPQTAIGILSKAIHKLGQSPFPSDLPEPTRRFFEFIGPEMAWPKRVVLANLWLFGPLVRNALARSPLTDALIRTTQAPTIFHGGITDNVLPTTARAVVNFRLLTGDTITGVVNHVRQAVDDPRVEITPLARLEPSEVADIESESFKVLQRSVAQTIPEAIAAPSLLVAGTDSRHYANLTRNIFRFVPITIGPKDAGRFHGIDERIAIGDYERCIRFYVQLMRNAAE